MIAVFEVLFSCKPVAGHIHVNIHEILYALLPAVRLRKTDNGHDLGKEQTDGNLKYLIWQNTCLVHNLTDKNNA
jgi:hypothetical protein